MTDVYTEWQKLCEEHDTVGDAYLDAFALVNRKFVEIARGTSRNNPIVNDLDKLEAAWDAWEVVKRSMSDFIKAHSSSFA